jgi:hypothetical protein
MAEYRRNEIVSGLFVCLAIVAFSLFAFRVGRFDLLGLFKGEALVFRAYFTDVKTLEPQQPVKVGGQSVGEVIAVRMVQRPLSEEQVGHLRDFNEEKAARGLAPGMMRQLIEIEFELTEPNLKLNPDTAYVTLGQESLLSSHFLILDPGEWQAGEEPLTIFDADFAVDAVIRAKEGTGYEELVAIVKPVVRELNSTLSTINQSLLSRENLKRFRNVLARAEETLVKGGDLFEDLNTAVGSIEKGFFNAENAGRLQTLLTRLEGTATGAESLANRLDALLDPKQDRRINDIVDHTVAATRNLKERLDAVQTDLALLLQQAVGVISDNRAEIAEVTRRLRRAVWQAELAMRKIRVNPAVLFFGDSEAEFDVAPTDASHLRHSGRTAPYGQRQENDR